MIDSGNIFDLSLFKWDNRDKLYMTRETMLKLPHIFPITHFYIKGKYEIKGFMFSHYGDAKIMCYKNYPPEDILHVYIGV